MDKNAGPVNFMTAITDHIWFNQRFLFMLTIKSSGITNTAAVIYRLGVVP